MDHGQECKGKYGMPVLDGPIVDGAELMRLSVYYESEDREGIDLIRHMHINAHCDPDIYAEPFIEILEAVLLAMKRANRRRMAQQN